MSTLDHPAVTNVINALRAHGVEPQVRWMPDAVTTAALAADALGIHVGQIANSLIFALDGEPVLILTSGAHRVDTAWLGAHLDGTIHRASKDMVKGATGQVIGGVAPVGHPQPIRTYVDTALAQYDEIWAAAGHARTVFPTSYDELLRMTGGTPTGVRADGGETI